MPHPFRRPLGALALLLALVTSAGPAPAGTLDSKAVPPVRVFLVAGQSNAEGSDSHASEIDSFPPFVGAGAPQADAMIWYEHDGPGGYTSGGWIPMQPATQTNILGPELTFAKKVTQETGARVAIVKSTSGGTTLAVDWDPGNTSGQQMYARTLMLLQKSLADLTSQGIPWQLEGVLWQQGENDMLDPVYVTQYGARLTALMQKLRTDLSLPGLRWYIGGTSFKCIWGLDYAGNMRTLRAQQLGAIGADPLATFVRSSHLAFKVNSQGDPHYHFGTEGQLQLGEAYADEYLKTLGFDVSHHPAQFSAGLPASPGDTVRVFVMVGQRSMEGEGAQVSEIQAHPGYSKLGALQQDVMYRYLLGGGVHVSPGWAPLGPADYLDSFGPELSFGDTANRLLDDPVAVIKIADSAAFLVDWLPQHPDSSRPQYDDAVRFIQNGLASLSSAGLNPVLEAVVWLPAEHDAWWTPYRQNYASRLATVAANLRTDLGAPTLKWFAAELPDGLTWGQSKLDDLDSKIQSVAAVDPLMWFVQTDSLSPTGPAPTIGTLGALELGRLLARTYVRTL
ncbi:MAG: sialate O-acetylesterase [Planctomycetota bacterium]|nr:sialate O-acetylesterase [Planctomycetota bacterium]